MGTNKREAVKHPDNECWTLRMAARELWSQSDGGVSQQYWRGFLAKQVKLGALPCNGDIIRADDVNDVLDLDERCGHFTPRLPSAMRSDEDGVVNWDNSMHASRWLGLAAISPQEAASLLCRADPLDEGTDPAVISTDETKSEDLKLLLRVFSDAQAVDPAHRSLLEWFEIAKDMGCKHHSWLEKYLAMRERLGLSAKAGEASDERQTEPPPIRMPKQRAQENRILELLASKNCDPLNLPMRKPGFRGVKSEAKTLALLEPALFTIKTFETSWQRLRDTGRVVDGK